MLWLRYPSARRDAAVEGAHVPAVKHCLLFFVPGNPGFIEYYATFLAALRSRLDEIEAKGPVRFTLVGRNLLGFDDGDDGDETGGGRYGAWPFDLATQIRAVADAVAAERIVAEGRRQGDVYDEVWVSGHSVGSYIALKVMRGEKEGGGEDAPAVHSPAPCAALLLFATLTHLAQSSRGRQLARLLGTPLLGPAAPWLAHGFLACWPVGALDWVVRRVLGFPPHAAAVTTRFLASRGGVRQALFLGGDELKQIGEDTWGSPLDPKGAEAGTAVETAVETAGQSLDAVDPSLAANTDSPHVFILFGQDDHWVANEYRDQFMARRAVDARGSIDITLDTRGLPHAFCIRHGEEVAETVSLWMARLAERL